MRSIFFTLGWLFLCAGATAAPVRFFTAERPGITLRTTLQFNMMTDAKNDALGVSQTALFDMRELVLGAGVSQTCEKSDFTAQVVYWPTFFGWLNMGLGFRYHFYNHPGQFQFREHDFQEGIFFNFNICPLFTIFFRLSDGQKISVLPAVSRSITDHFIPSFELLLSWHFLEMWSVYSGTSLCTLFDYPEFCTLFFYTGFSAQVTESAFAGAELCTKWNDMVIVSHNMTHWNIRVYGGWRL